STISCIASCQPWQQCRPTIDGGVCDSLNLSLAWNSPDAGLAFNTATVPARLTVTRTGGPIPSTLTSVPVFGQPGPSQAGQGPLSPLTGSAGTYTGALPLFAPDAVNKTFVAGWPDGGPTATLVIERDTTPPAVSLSLLPRPTTDPDPDPVDPTRWKRHETALLRVDVFGGRTALATDLFVPDSGVVFTASATNCCGTAPTCRCFELGLGRAPVIIGGRMSNPEEQIRVAVAPIRDAVGNASPVQEDVFTVSRYFWSRPVPSPGALTLAVASDGTIVTTAQNGVVQAYEPDGGLLWSNPLGPNIVFFSAPTIGAADVYVSVREPGSSRIQRLSLSTGMETGRLCDQSNTEVFGPITLGTGIVGAEIPFAVRAGLLSVGLGSCPEGKTDEGASAVVARNGPTQLELFTAGSTALHKLSFDGFTVEDAGVLSGPSGNLFLAGSRVGWHNISAIESASSVGPLAGPTISTSPEGALVPPVVSGSTVFATSSVSGQFVACPFSSSTGVFGACAPSPVTAPAGSTTSPYFVGASGKILEIANSTVRERTPSGAVVGLPFNLPASPTIGAAALVPMRNPNGLKRCGTGVGLLYVRLPNELAAFIVDIEGLDGAAPWPMFRHDPANSGSLNRSLAPWSCP
ncbi:MAG: hypothetical protein MUC96_26965, partial [Myxococcaceae bacterium]|nr:hypothetical protein [Myxococcaceae bacterium]